MFPLIHPVLAALPEDPGALLELGAQLFKDQNYRAVAALLIFAVVRYGGPLLATKAPFFGTGKGKATLVLITALVTGLYDAFQPGVVPATAFLIGSLKNAFIAAGGFSLVSTFFKKETK